MGITQMTVSVLLHPERRKAYRNSEDQRKKRAEYKRRWRKESPAAKKWDRKYYLKKRSDPDWWEWRKAYQRRYQKMPHYWEWRKRHWKTEKYRAFIRHRYYTTIKPKRIVELLQQFNEETDQLRRQQ